MISGRQRERIFNVVGAIVATVFVLSLLLIAALNQGCTSTVTPTIVEPVAPSYDGNERNSGIIDVTPAGWTVTAHFRDRYNALIDTYGKRFAPALDRDAGIFEAIPVTNPPRWIIDHEHFDHFLKMNAWRRSGVLP